MVSIHLVTTLTKRGDDSDAPCCLGCPAFGLVNSRAFCAHDSLEIPMPLRSPYDRPADCPDPDAADDPIKELL